MLIKHGPKPKKARKDVSDDDVSNELQTEKMEEASAQQTKTSLLAAIELQVIIGVAGSRWKNSCLRSSHTGLQSG